MILEYYNDTFTKHNANNVVNFTLTFDTTRQINGFGIMSADADVAANRVPTSVIVSYDTTSLVDGSLLANDQYEALDFQN